MLKPYRDEFTTELDMEIKMHPSTHVFAYITKNIVVAHLTSAFILLLICLINGFAPTDLGAVIGLVGVVWIAYTSTTLIRSPAVRKRHYNKYLYPIESAFNQLDWKEQREHKELLKKCYQIAARGDNEEFDELIKVRELFELSVPEKKKTLSVDQQLEIKRAKIRDQQQQEKQIQDIMDELKKENGI